MAKIHSLLTFSLLLLLFNGCFAQVERVQDPWRTQHSLKARTDCSITRLTAQEPRERYEYEAGETEYWDSQNQEFQCAGVDVVRNVIQPRGLLLPHYNNAPQLLYVIQGSGIQGTVFSGCPETYESEVQSSRQILSDRHQKVRQFKQGDIIALPAGVTLWFYNNGEVPIQTISLLDTSNEANQLDLNFRNFFLAGNEQQSGSFSHGRQQQQQQGNAHNVFRGFDEELLQEVFNVDRETARSLQGYEDQRGRIVRADNFQVLIPGYEDEQQQEDWRSRRSERPQQQGGRPEREQEHGGRDERRREEERPQQQGGRHEREQEHGGRDERRREEERPQQQGGRHEREQEQGGRDERRREEEYERRGEEGYERRREEEYPGDRRGRGGSNGLEETFCSMKLRENIENPSRADLYNVRGGHIATVNSQTLPILNYLKLSAERGTLYGNALIAPHWTMNAHSIIYVIRGSARIQVVGNEGRSLLDEEVRQGQLVIVPQNFAVVKKASDEGFEYIAFKTNENAVTSDLAGRLSALRGIPVDVLVNSYQISREDAQTLKYSRQEATLLSPTRGSSSRSRIEKAMNLAMKAIGSVM